MVTFRDDNARCAVTPAVAISLPARRKGTAMVTGPARKRGK
jgi:hypothetical protein